MKDFNSDPSEYGGRSTEYNAAEENASFVGNPTPKELQSSEAFGGKVVKTKKKRREGVGFLPGLIVAAVIAVAAVAFIAPSSRDVNVEIASAETTNTTVSYEINVDSDESLDAVLYNDFTHRRFPLEKGENRNVFEDLRADTEYTLAIVGNFGFGEKTIAKQTVKTADAPTPVTEWRDNVELKCRCIIDGYFYFRMDFIDENGYFTDFEATLTDINGTVSACVFSEDLHAWQRIDVANNIDLIGRKMQLKITCRTSEPGAETEIRVLFDSPVSI